MSGGALGQRETVVVPFGWFGSRSNGNDSSAMSRSVFSNNRGKSVIASVWLRETEQPEMISFFSQGERTSRRRTL